MSSVFGKNIRVSVFGQSHSEAIGCTVDTLPAGERISLSALERFLKRRAPGRALTTPRSEKDFPEFICGVLADREDADSLITCGAPLTAVIRNTDTHSSDYAAIADLPRPSHADYTAQIAYNGFQDVRGGGHFSGRLTAPLCVAGGICKQILERRGIFIGAHIASVGNISDELYNPCFVSREELEAPGNAEDGFAVIDSSRGELMKALISEVGQCGDSIGGSVECAVTGLEAGLGAPMAEGLESRYAAALFAIPAMKGLEFGNGFESAAMRGSENNDAFVTDGGAIRTETNRHGGILGGLSSGMPLVFRAAFKPTPSIALPQQSVSLAEKKEKTLLISGRHDPCIVVRAVAAVEAVAAIVTLDVLLDSKKILIFPETRNGKDKER